MDERTEQLIRELATKLGTTSEYLWEVLIQQAKISAIYSLILVILILFGNGVFYYLISNRYRDSFNEGDPIPILGTILSVVSAIVAIMSLQNIVTGFLNPEYWALQHILQLLR